MIRFSVLIGLHFTYWHIDLNMGKYFPFQAIKFTHDENIILDFGPIFFIYLCRMNEPGFVSLASIDL